MEIRSNQLATISNDSINYNSEFDFFTDDSINYNPEFDFFTDDLTDNAIFAREYTI